MDTIDIEKLVTEQKAYFDTGVTKSEEFRRAQLKALKQSIIQHSDSLNAALYADLHKCTEEAYLTEYSIVIKEIDAALKHLHRWMRPQKVKTPLFLFPSRSRIYYEPFGVALIIAPWNYPFNLTFSPLVGAIAAGCCAVVKPSPYSVHTSAVMQTIIDETFDSKYIALVQGHREINAQLLKQPFNMMFFTGSPVLGKEVMHAAANHLANVVLELGGKSPCVVDADANLDVAARRLAWGKTINAGQTCIAPDYLLVHEKVKDVLLEKIKSNFIQFFGENQQQSEHYCRIINDKAFARLSSYLCEGHIVYGGSSDASNRYIQPTIIDEITPQMAIMNDEIFGPILPVMTFKDINEVRNFVSNRPKPLAFYYFGKNNEAKKMLQNISSGGACVNDTLLHIANGRLPFGGVNNSGLGKYHDKASFTAFSNARSVLWSSTKIDFTLKYPPYKGFEIIKKLY